MVKFIKIFLLFVSALCVGCASVEQSGLKSSAIKSQWQGKTVAFLGDSITDPNHTGAKKKYWQYLSDSLGINEKVYARSGYQFSAMLSQAKKMNEELGQNVDAILIFVGTNDYNASVPLGEWYELKDATRHLINNETKQDKRRFPSMDKNTLRGRINILMSYLKENFPDQQIVLLTPIHRGFAKFNKTNVQPDEGFSNKIGLYIGDYVEAIKEAGNVWAVPVIDLNADCALYPNAKSNVKFFVNEKRDMLHPNAAGHYKMAQAIMYRLLALPSDFKTK